MGIRQMIHRVRTLLTISLILSLILISFSFIVYQDFEKNQQQETLSADEIDSSKPEALKKAELLPGYKLFKEWGCNNCHAVDKKLVGPALANIRERRSDTWLQDFIKNPAKVIDSGDEYALKLYNEYKPAVMQNHDLSDEQITSILDYITEASK